MPAPFVSVVLPTFNRANHLRRSIGSVINQSFKDFELLVVDDGSTDHTQDVVSAFGDTRVRYIRREKNGGVAAARNTGLHAARGTFLAFQDSDDEWLLEKLDRQIQVLQQAGQSFDMVICGVLRVGRTHVRAYPSISLNEWKQLSRAEVVAQPIAYTQSWLVRRDAVLKAGGFDERLRVWDDWELLIRLSMETNICIFSEPLVISQAVADSISKQTGRFLHDMGLILENHGNYLCRYPRELSRLETRLVRRLLSAGQVADAEQSLRRTLRRDSLSWRPRLLLLLLKIGGPSSVIRMLNWSQRGRVL